MTALISRLVHRVDQTLRQAGDRVPMHADPSGEWTWSSNEWSDGYWPGLLQLCASATGDERYARAATSSASALRPRLLEQTVLRGHLFFYGAARVDPQLATDAGHALCEAFDHGAGLISPGDEDTHRYGWPRRGACIDGTPGIVGLLTLAGRQDLAVKHVRRHAELCVREDGSVAQTAARDGARANHSGASPQGTWARAQAWAMLGLAQAVRVEPELTAIAGRVADWWLAHLPADGISRWEFAAPTAPLDTSAAAIAAAALATLERHQAAAAAVDALTRHVSPPGGLLNGCYERAGCELAWGDYFLLEAALAAHGHRQSDV